MKTQWWLVLSLAALFSVVTVSSSAVADEEKECEKKKDGQTQVASLDDEEEEEKECEKKKDGALVVDDEEEEGEKDCEKDDELLRA